MSIDKVEQSEAQARAIAQKRKAVQDEENALETERARIARARAREANVEQEKNDKNLVEISKAAEKQADAVKKMNTDRVRLLNENSEKNYTKLAGETAEKIKLLEKDAMKSIDEHRSSSMERLKSVMEQSEDPFYRVKTLQPQLAENDKEYTIKVKLPEYEAQNLFATGEGSKVKISLARRFQEKVTNPESDNITKTNNYQSITEQIEIPGAFDAKNIRKNYSEGVVTVFVPKILPKTPGSNS